jgi:hypothetical protein
MDASSCLFIALASTARRAVADEGGVSFRLPGTCGSLSAVPGVPGWSFSTFNYYDWVGAAKDIDFVRGGRISAGLNARVDFQYLYPAYVFATPVLGGRASIGMGALVGPLAFGTVTAPAAGRCQRLKAIPFSAPTTSIRLVRSDGTWTSIAL